MLPMDYAEPDTKIIEVYKRRRSFVGLVEAQECHRAPTRCSECRGPVTATPLNLLGTRSTVKKNNLRAEALEQRVVPSILGSTLSAAVALPRPPEQGIAVRERSRGRESGIGQETDRGNLRVVGPEPHVASRLATRLELLRNTLRPP